MIKGVRGATIWSEDMNNLLPFYRDLLGFKVAIQMDPIENINIEADSSFVLALEAQRRELVERRADERRRGIGGRPGGRDDGTAQPERGLEALSERGVPRRRADLDVDDPLVPRLA